MRIRRLRNAPAQQPARGKIIVAEQVLTDTRKSLQDAGSGDPPHEGLVFWLGRESGKDTLIQSCCTPQHDSGPGYVSADEASVGSVMRAARAFGLGLVAQVHSHPGSWVAHSKDDDELVLMPFEGMYSLVVGHYGFSSMLPAEGAGLHQYQDGRWVLLKPEGAMVVAPPTLEA